MSVKEEHVDKYFQLQSKRFEELSILDKPGNIVNIDKTGNEQQFKRRVIVGKGAKIPYKGQHFTMEHTTTAHAATTSGEQLPTMIITKAVFPTLFMKCFQMAGFMGLLNQAS